MKVTIDRFEGDLAIVEIASFFRTKQGRGYVCTIEMVERSNGVYYFFAYPDDYVRDSLVHDEDDQLVHRTIRQTFEVVFAYDSIDGNSELSAKLPKRVKESLEAIFLRHTLGVEPEEEEQKPFDLSMLLNRDFELTVRPEDRIKVGITSFTLTWVGQATARMSTRYPDSARELAFQKLRPECFAWPDVVVSRVRFRFEFLAADGGRSRFLTFEIGAPFYCTLKNQHPELEEIIHRYLKEWRMEHDPNQDAAACGNDEAAAGVFARKRA